MDCRHLILVQLIYCATCAGALFGQDQPTQQQLTQDLHQFAVELPERYAELFAKRPQEEFDVAIANLRARLPVIGREGFRYELQKITTMFTNGRTHVEFGPKALMVPYVAVRFKLLGDGVYVSAIRKEHANLLGSKLVRISGMDAGTFVEAIGDYVPHQDNVSGLRWIFDSASAHPELLRAMGLEKNGKINLTVESAGKEFNVEVNVPPADKDNQTIVFADNSQMTLGQASQTPRWYRSPDEGTLYFNCVRCRTENELRLFIERTEQLLKKHEVKRLVIDLRRNNFMHPHERESKVPVAIVDYLGNHQTLNQSGKLFAVIGRETLASGFIKLSELREQTNVIFVGEEPGVMPPLSNSVNFKSFVLRNTGVKIKYDNRAKLSTETTVAEQAPDIAVELTSRNWFGVEDPFMAAILQYQAEN